MKVKRCSVTPKTYLFLHCIKLSRTICSLNEEWQPLFHSFYCWNHFICVYLGLEMRLFFPSSWFWLGISSHWRNVNLSLFLSYTSWNYFFFCLFLFFFIDVSLMLVSVFLLYVLYCWKFPFCLNHIIHHEKVANYT